MKVTCQIIKDLLPLYKDGVCSEDSKNLIEEHLLQCEDCKHSLDLMGNTLEIEELGKASDEVESLKKLSKNWNSKLTFSMIKGAFSTLIIVALVVLLIYTFIGIKIG